MPKLKTNDIETYYETRGEGTALVLIPGVGACHKLWQPQVEPFSRHFKVIVYDVRGHGDSTGSNEKYSIALFASDLKTLWEGLGVNKAHICGLSLGGLIAQQFVLDYPRIVDRLVLVGTFSYVGGPLRLLIPLANLAKRLLYTFFSIEQIMKRGAKVFFKKPEQQELREFFVKEVVKISKKEYFKVVDATYAFNSLDRLKEIKAPTLIINAEGEKVERKQADIFLREIKNSRKALILDTFHASNLEKPEEFNKLVMDFLLE